MTEEIEEIEVTEIIERIEALEKENSTEKENIRGKIAAIESRLKSIEDDFETLITYGE